MRKDESLVKLLDADDAAEISKGLTSRDIPHVIIMNGSGIFLRAFEKKEKIQ